MTFTSRCCIYDIFYNILRGRKLKVKSFLLCFVLWIILSLLFTGFLLDITCSLLLACSWFSFHFFFTSAIIQIIIDISILIRFCIACQHLYKRTAGTSRCQHVRRRLSFAEAVNSDYFNINSCFYIPAY